MKRLRFSDEQIAYALRQAESGAAVADVCRQLGISDATLHVCKKKYGNLGASEPRELRLLREENAKLKRLVADLTLDKHILGEIVRKKFEAGAAARARGLGPDRLWDESVAGVSAGADLQVTAWLPQLSPRPGGATAADVRGGAGPASLRLPPRTRHAAL
jgi:putative transposase